MQEKYYQLRRLIESMEEDVCKFNDQNNRSAGLRVRKAMQEAKGIAQDIRKHILEKRKGNLQL